MAVLTHRLQVLLDEERLARLAREAERRGSSVGNLVREAIDIAFPVDGVSRGEAARLLLDAEPIEVGDWTDLKAEIELMYPTHQ
ncbi:MAG: CopG family transcriptional regulator [Pseudonocardia sp.]